MPWKHEWWCPICWVMLLFRVACRVAYTIDRVFYLVVSTPLYAATHPSWVLVKIIRLLFTPIRVPLLLLLVVVHERGWNQVVRILWWVYGTPRLVAIVNYFDQWWYWCFPIGPSPPLGSLETLPDRVVPVDDRFVPDERPIWSEPTRVLALTSEPEWPGPHLSSQ